jgi:hypothetical protein
VPEDVCPPITVVADRIIGLLRESPRGVIVLATDGLGWASAMAAIRHGSADILLSSFPSTSVTAWTSALTGANSGDHGLVGTMFRLPGKDLVVNVLEGQARSWTDAVPWADHPFRSATLFDRAAEDGVRSVVIGREFDGLRGPWPDLLFHGAQRVLSVPHDLPAEATSVARSVVAQVNDFLSRSSAPLLLWVYVNLDNHIHRRGNDDALLRSVQYLGQAALTWADDGWTVVMHSDHGHTEVVRDPDSERLWNSVDQPGNCRLPSGGAGRVRWLYPKPEKADVIAATLRSELGGCALVTTPGTLAMRGLISAAASESKRIGEIVLVATAATFPIPSPDFRCEHGALTREEVQIPFITWRR